MAQRDRARFSTIDFGSLAAETEAARSPELLLEGFYDPRGHANELATGDRFLVLGSKGSGKSALVQHLSLSNASNPRFRINHVNLADLPWADVSKIKTGESADSTRATSAWKWFLLLRLYQELANAEGLKFRSDAEIQVLLEGLRAAGLLAESIHHVVDTTTKKTLKVRLGVFEGSREVGEKTVHLNLASEEMARLLSRLCGERELDRFVLAIDGLDGLLLDGKSQWSSMSALVAACLSLNQRFVQASIPVRIWLLMRRSVFDRLNYAESNKVKHDWGLDISWGTGAGGDGSLLVGLANKKAEVSAGREIDVLSQFFPPRLSFIRSSRGNEKRTREFLLSYTRFTPRDYLTLMRIIGTGCGYRVTEPHLKEGLREYATSHFVTEVRNDLVSVTEDDHAARAVLELLASLDSKKFTLETLVELAAGYPEKRSIVDSLRQMYDAGAIGLIQEYRDRSLQHYVFAYKGDQVPFRPNATFILHNGLIRAYSLPF